jgi:hypothetical protein
MLHKTSQTTIIFHRKTSLKKLLRIILAALLFVSIAFICYSNYSIYLTGSYLSNLYKSMYIEYNNQNQSRSDNTSLSIVNVSSIINLTTNSSNHTIVTLKNSKSSSILLDCPLIPPNLGTRVQLNLNNKSLNEIETEFRTINSDLKLGGFWSPKICKPRYKVAIIVPYRDRMQNLELFLMHMHPFLQKQQLEYGIYLVEPQSGLTFNRGFLMNIGFVESLKDYEKWECHVFHDVDLLPEDERNIYSCPETPRHMSSAVSTLKYR